MKSGRATTAGWKLRGTRAFTLLEIMVAVVAFGIVLWAISAVFTTALRLRNRTSALYEEALPLQRAMDILKKDLASITASSGTNTLAAMFEENFGGAPIGMMAAQTQLRPPFYTATGQINDNVEFGDVMRVSYYLMTSTNGLNGKDLVRASTRNLLPTSQGEETYQFLLTGVENVEFTFYDGFLWRNVFDTSTDITNATQAIRVDVTMAQNDRSAGSFKLAPISLIVPIMVQSHTNVVDDGTQ